MDGLFVALCAHVLNNAVSKRVSKTATPVTFGVDCRDITGAGGANGKILVYAFHVYKKVQMPAKDFPWVERYAAVARTIKELAERNAFFRAAICPIYSVTLNTECLMLQMARGQLITSDYFLEHFDRIVNVIDVAASNNVYLPDAKFENFVVYNHNVCAIDCDSAIIFNESTKTMMQPGFVLGGTYSPLVIYCDAQAFLQNLPENERTLWYNFFKNFIDNLCRSTLVACALSYALPQNYQYTDVTVKIIDVKSMKRVVQACERKFKKILDLMRGNQLLLKTRGVWDLVEQISQQVRFTSPEIYLSSAEGGHATAMEL